MVDQLVLFETPAQAEFATFVEHVCDSSSVTPEQLQSCLAVQKTDGGRLEEIMLERGLITRAEILEVREQQAKAAAELHAAEIKRRSFPRYLKLSVVFPCYNEAEVIGNNLDEALRILPKFVRDFEVIVVDDGSHDRTAEIVTERAQSDPRIRLVQHEENRGYGAAVTSGFRAAKGDVVCLNDGDGQFSLIDLPNLLVEYGKADVVFGYRHQRADRAIRSLNAKAWNLLIRLLLGARVRDLDCAFKLIPKWVIDEIDLTSSGACISAEIVTQCIRGGLRVAEVPVNHYPRCHGDATGARLEVIGKSVSRIANVVEISADAEIDASRSCRSPQPHG